MDAVLSWQATEEAPPRPWATYFLALAVTVAVFLQLALSLRGLDMAGFVYANGVVSAEFSWTDPQAYLSLVTYNFLHSGGRHFAGNILLMIVASIAVEKYAGRRATLFIWLAGGIAGGLVHLMVFPDSARALIGASGAISALLGAALVIGWRWALPVKVWRGRRTLFHVRLPFVLGIWLAFQFHGVVRLASGSLANSTVATWVHIAGFAFGMVVAIGLALMRQREGRIQSSNV